MRTWKLTSLLMMVCVWTFTLTSCGDDVTYYTIQNSDEMLCSRTWVEEYDTTNEDGVMVSCVHQLKFSALHNDKSGQEFTNITTPGRVVRIMKPAAISAGNGWTIRKKAFA